MQRQKFGREFKIEAVRLIKDVGSAWRRHPLGLTLGQSQQVGD